MRSDNSSTVVRLRAPNQRSHTASVVLSAARKPVFVDEVDTLLVEEREQLFISRRHHRAGQLLSLILIPLLLIHPFIRVYAAEEPEPPIPPAENVDTLSASETTPTDATVNQTDETPGPESNSVQSDTVQEASVEESATGTDATLVEDTESIPVNAGESGSTGLIDDGATSTASSTDDQMSGGEVVSDDIPEPTADQSEAPVDAESESAIENPLAEEPSINLDELLRQREESMRAELRRQVEKELLSGCVSLENSGFYCLKESPTKFSGDVTPSKELGEVVAEKGNSGDDKEIFIVRGGELLQLTSNDWEDAFPARDLTGNTVVWQSSINGRWQIFVANVASVTPTIMQLTQGSENNFNPRVENGSVVWQAWVDNNWEIYYATPHKGTPRGIDERLSDDHLRVGVDGAWDVMRITQDPAHDMFPSIANGVITWQKAELGGWSIYAYALNGGVLTKISTSEGKSERPRFALVWDQEGSDGRKLMSYDLATGKEEDLTQTAREAPYQKPYTPTAPVSSDNQAALTLSTQTSSKNEGDGSDGGDGSGGDTPPDDTTYGSATSTDIGSVVDLSASQDHVVDLSGAGSTSTSALQE